MLCVNNLRKSDFLRNVRLFHISVKTLNKDYYEVLNVKRNSSRQEIKTAYYKLSKMYHPDVNKEEDAKVKFREIQDAYDVLGNESTKQEYDLSLRQGYGGGGGSGMAYEDPDGYVVNRNFKKRSGPMYTGRTSAYDFDEHFKSHYGPSSFGATAQKKPPPYRGAKQPRTDAELNSYWNKKVFTATSDSDIKNRFLRNTFACVIGMLIVYLVAIKMKDREDEVTRRNYLKSLETKTKSNT